MKTRLPKPLLMALLATICTGAAHASIYAPGGGLIVTKEQEDVTITQDTTGITAPAINGTTQYAPFVKDGAGNAVIDGNLNMTAALYVREGKLTISGADTTVTINPGWGSLVAGNAPTIFSVAGTNTTGSNSEDIYATLVIDGPTSKTAGQWLLQASIQGNLYAQVDLAFYYENGLGGFAKDVDEGLKWYQMAACQGNEIAQERLTEYGLSW